MKHVLLTSVVFLLLPLAVLAQAAPVPAGGDPLVDGADTATKKRAGWLGHSNKVEDTPSKKSLHGFGASLVVVKNEEFFNQWQAGQGGSGAVAVPLVRQVKQIEPFWVVVFTTGAGVDGSNCNVTFDVSVKRPDFTEFKKFENLSACNDTKQDPGVIYLSNDKALVELTLDEPSGKYAIDAVVHDKVKQVDLKLFRALDVLGPDSPKGVIGGESMKLPLTEKKVLVDDQGNPIKELPATTPAASPAPPPVPALVAAPAPAPTPAPLPTVHATPEGGAAPMPDVQFDETKPE